MSENQASVVGPNSTLLKSPGMEIAEQAIRETEEKAVLGLTTLKQMIIDDIRICCPTDDEFLIKFLRCVKFDTALAFKTVKCYCEIITKNPSIYQVKISDFVNRLGSAHIPMVMPERLHDGSKLMVARAGIWKPQICSVNDVLSMIAFVTEYMARDPMTQISGVVFVVDYKGLNLFHCRHITRSAMQIAVSWLQDCTPLIHNSIHIVNTPVVFDLVYALFSKLASKEVRKKLVLHGKNLESLYSYIPRSHLPDDLGGTAGPFDSDSLIQSLLLQEKSIMDAFDVKYVK